MTEVRPIKSIVIGKRHRKDLGDIAGFAARLKNLGVLLHPIVIQPDNTLIAGERRLAACKALGWAEVPVTVVDLPEIVRGEFAENADRKDFLPSEIDAIRRELEPLEKAVAKENQRKGGRGKKGTKVSQPFRTADKIGAFAGISGRNVQKIKKIVEAAEHDPTTHANLIEEMDTHGVDRAYRSLRRSEHLARIATISKADSPLPQDRKYPIILADPPWKFEVYDGASGFDEAADNHYPTMPLTDICALPIADLATPDAVLFLWSTASTLREAFAVLDAWGFEYVTNIVWAKGRPSGLGFWTRNQHELLLLARRGNPPTPRRGDRPSSVITAPRREHSRKPDEAYEIIERMYPELPKIELFARGGRKGWATWGNQANRKIERVRLCA